MLGRNYSDKGCLLLEQGKVEEGEKLVMEALNLFKKIENPLAESKCWTRLGVANVQKGNTHEAELQFKTSVEKSRACCFQYGEATALFELGKLYNLLAKVEDARHNLESAQRIFEMCGDLESAKKCKVLLNPSSPEGSPAAGQPISNHEGDQPHIFEVFKLKKATLCASCNKYIWGVAKTALRCSACAFLIHKQCSTTTPQHCSGKKAHDHPSPLASVPIMELSISNPLPFMLQFHLGSLQLGSSFFFQF